MTTIAELKNFGTTLDDYKAIVETAIKADANTKLNSLVKELGTKAVEILTTQQELTPQEVAEQYATQEDVDADQKLTLGDVIKEAHTPELTEAQTAALATLKAKTAVLFEVTEAKGGCIKKTVDIIVALVCFLPRAAYYCVKYMVGRTPEYQVRNALMAAKQAFGGKMDKSEAMQAVTSIKNERATLEKAFAEVKAEAAKAAADAKAAEAAKKKTA